MKILVTEPDNYSKKAIDIYQGLGEVFYKKKLSRDELLRAVQDAELIIIRLAHTIDKEIIDRASRLRMIVSPTTGLDHIDIKYAESRGIEVVSLKGEVEFLKKVHATSEQTFALILSLIRKIPWNFTSVVERHEWKRDLYKGRELFEKTLGIIGFGRLGSRVAKIARGFDMNVLAHDPHVSKSEIETGGATPVDLNYLLQQSDIISLHVALTAETKNLIDQDAINKIKNGAIIVNTARGDLIDEEALLSALESGKISGAALDVLSDELGWGDKGIMPKIGVSVRLVDHAKLHDNLIITSHLGGATYESMEKTEIFIAEKVKNYLNSKINTKSSQT